MSKRLCALSRLAGDAPAGLVMLAVLACLAAAVAVLGPDAGAETLREALANAYRANPRLDAERARLRATDEEIARANAGFMPNVAGSAEAGQQSTGIVPNSSSAGASQPWGYTLTLTQPVFKGFRVVNAVREAEAQVRAGRENLRNVEQQVLLEAATAYVDVVRDTALVRLRQNHVDVLAKDLEATEARRSVREVTKTDVAQAKARRAKAIATLDQARAALKSSRAAYEKAVGAAPGRLVAPAPLRKVMPRSLDEAIGIAEQESPNVVSALYREQAARIAVDRIWGELLPEVKLEAQYAYRGNPAHGIDEQDVASIAGRVNIPIWAGGEVQARVRQAKHTHVSRLQEIEQAKQETQAVVVQAWARYQSARAQLKSNRVQVDANRTALEGVREEEKVGQRTLLDVLNAEQELLDAQVQLIVTQRDLVVACFGVLASVGRLSAEQLELTTHVYDPSAHTAEVRRNWFGLDITHADGRRENVDVTVGGDEEWELDE